MCHFLEDQLDPCVYWCTLSEKGKECMGMKLILVTDTHSFGPKLKQFAILQADQNGRAVLCCHKMEFYSF